jgi:DNA polymerase III subunit beta
MTSIDTVVGTSMKLTCAKDGLSEKLQVAGRGVSTRTTVQILAGILLNAAGGRLSLSATDMEISLRVSLEAQVEDEGSVVVPGRLLVDIVRLLPAGEVTISHRAEEGVVELVCGSASYRLNTYAAEDFPRLPEIEDANAFTVQKEAFVDTIARVSRSASRDESRPVLTGVLVRFEGDKLVMAATDSYRLSVKETALPDSPGREIEAIVPARALGELARIAQGEGETIQVGVQENQVVFGVDDVWLTARRIDGQFPNYKQLMPETFDAQATLPREEFLEVVRRASLMAQRKSPLRLSFSEGEVTVSAQTQDVGEAHETLPIEYKGEPLEIGFNAEFLRDGLESLNDQDAKIQLISPLRPGLIVGEADDFQYLIMPIRLAG